MIAPTVNYAACYWVVVGNKTQVYSSASAGYVPLTDATYQAWLARGNITFQVASEAELWTLLSAVYPAGIASTNTAGQTAYQTYKVSTLDQRIFNAILYMENQIRALQNPPLVALTPAQLLTALESIV